MRKFYMIINLFFLFGITSSIAWAEDNVFVKNTLCLEQEEVYFTCILENQKIASVCKNEKNSEEDYAQYRYGTPDNIEMKYPEKRLPAKGHIFYVNDSAGSVSSTSLFFQTGLYGYTIFDTQGNVGLYVEKGKPTDIDKKTVFLQDCEGDVYTTNWESWKESFQDGKEYKWTGKNKPM